MKVGGQGRSNDLVLAERIELPCILFLFDFMKWHPPHG
ncbi:hypothetical protein YSA_06393 [Pseudomonas putida ND6]|uniref:Uncharacterized protein n=1 Tax=Pseudomonas putida ND6 TaxID=231023 RepID=I3UXJ2_PSEPU|nr:hypothetical protein YSA_06393 [Pseudomonas putida ND6]